MDKRMFPYVVSTGGCRLPQLFVTQRLGHKEHASTATDLVVTIAAAPSGKPDIAKTSIRTRTSTRDWAEPPSPLLRYWELLNWNRLHAGSEITNPFLRCISYFSAQVNRSRHVLHFLLEREFEFLSASFNSMSWYFAAKRGCSASQAASQESVVSGCVIAYDWLTNYYFNYERG